MNVNNQIVHTQPQEIVKEAHLRYVHDGIPGITRENQGKEVIYLDTNKRKITDQKILTHIQKLKIPPAWHNVWISPLLNGHIQATGLDEKERKQYIYHPEWIRLSQENKFHKMIPFAQQLPNMRSKINIDLQNQRLTQEKVLATIVWLIDHTYIRIGNKEYARENQHFGITTLHNDHVKVYGETVLFEFIGKSGKKHHLEIIHPKIAKTIHTLEELPGQEIFKYVDEYGHTHPINSEEVNEYLKSLTKDSFTAKDFRTWGGTVLSATTLHTLGDFQTEKEKKNKMTAAVKEVASHLRNTPKVARDYYIHPTIFTSYSDKILINHFNEVITHTVPPLHLNKEEHATHLLLQNYSTT